MSRGNTASGGIDHVCGMLVTNAARVYRCHCKISGYQLVNSANFNFTAGKSRRGERFLRPGVHQNRRMQRRHDRDFDAGMGVDRSSGCRAALGIPVSALPAGPPSTTEQAQQARSAPFNERPAKLFSSGVGVRLPGGRHGIVLAI